VDAYRKAIEQRGGFYPEAHQGLGGVLYSMDKIDAANAEYSLAVRQRNGKGTQHITGSETVRAPRQEATEDLGNALRQAPAIKDTLSENDGTVKIDVRPTQPTEPVKGTENIEAMRGTETFEAVRGTVQIETVKDADIMKTVRDIEQTDNLNNTVMIGSEQSEKEPLRTAPLVSPRTKEAGES